MPTYVVVAPQRVLAAELTEVAPRRTLPDWYLGDRRHKAGTSDHNIDDTPGWSTEQTDADSIPEVRGGDYRLPFRAPFTPEQFVQWLVRRARAGKLPWLRYIIYNRRIWTRSGGWVTQRYNGSNPHDHHVHVSSLASHDNDRTSPALAELVRSVRPTPTEDEPMTPEQLLAALKNPQVAAELSRLPWAFKDKAGDGGKTAHSLLLLELPAATRKAAALGVHDALHVAYSGEDFNGLPYGSPGAVGATIKRAVTGLIVTPLIEAIAAGDLDEQQVAELLAPLVVEGVVAKLPTDLDDVTIDELHEVFRRAFLAQPAELDAAQPVDEPTQ